MNKRNKWIVSLGIAAIACVAFGVLFLKSHNSYSISVIDTAAAEIPAPTLPDITGFTANAVKKLLPPIKVGEVQLKDMESSKFFDLMAMRVLLPDFAEQQGRTDPISIEIIKGVYDIPTLAKQLNDPTAIEKTADGWILRLPVIIYPEATLIISGKDNAVKMSAEKGTFISNFGQLYTVNSTITGWREDKNEPATYEDSKTYRPYLVFWSGSKTFLAGTDFLSLGYNFPKSYGVTFSSSAKMLRSSPEAPSPTGWLVDSLFKDIYYGFYSYEAEDVAIVGNTYADNIIYGIDPHDSSKRLIIAENDSYGTRKKHGIIISRKVEDSWIFNNHSHNNHGSGIMLERNCSNNIVAGNLVENNDGDGIVFFESPDNISWENTIRNNKKSGIRIRNSTNITIRGDKIINSGSYGIEAYTASLEEKTRDIKLDPYKKKTSYDIANVTLDKNVNGHFDGSNVDSAKYSNLKMLRSYKYFKGDLEPHEGEICANATLKNKSVAAVSNSWSRSIKTDTRDAE